MRVSTAATRWFSRVLVHHGLLEILWGYLIGSERPACRSAWRSLPPSGRPRSPACPQSVGLLRVFTHAGQALRAGTRGRCHGQHLRPRLPRGVAWGATAFRQASDTAAAAARYAGAARIGSGGAALADYRSHIKAALAKSRFYFRGSIPCLVQCPAVCGLHRGESGRPLGSLEHTSIRLSHVAGDPDRGVRDGRPATRTTPIVRRRARDFARPVQAATPETMFLCC